MKIRLIFAILLFSSIALTHCSKNDSPSSPEIEFEPIQLTSSGHDFECYWSPNNQYIAFRTSRNTFDPLASVIFSELWIMDKNGENQRPLILVDEIYNYTDVKSVSWAPNSMNMIVNLHGYSPSTKSEVWQVNINGNKFRLSSPEVTTQYPSYSPDGNKVAFVLQNQDPLNYRLYVAETDFSDTIFITEGLIGDYDWHSDSKSIVYSLLDRDEGNYDLWEAGIDGLTKKRMSNTPENEEILCCSCDGNYIAYSDWNSIYYTPINSFNPIHIIDNARLPQWIPNRNLILYFNEQNEDNMRFWTESWIVDLNGNVVKKIAEGEASQTSFSSTGDYYVYSVNGNIWLDYLPL